jgi:hypothetical protein
MSLGSRNRRIRSTTPGNCTRCYVNSAQPRTRGLDVVVAPPIVAARHTLRFGCATDLRFIDSWMVLRTGSGTSISARCRHSTATCVVARKAVQCRVRDHVFCSLHRRLKLSSPSTNTLCVVACAHTRHGSRRSDVLYGSAMCNEKLVRGVVAAFPVFCECCATNLDRCE